MQRIVSERISSEATGRMLMAFAPPTTDDIPGVMATGPVAELKYKWTEEKSEAIYLVEILDENNKATGVYSFLLSCGILFDKFLTDVDNSENSIASSDCSSEGEDGVNMLKVSIGEAGASDNVAEHGDSKPEEQQEIKPNQITKSYPAVKIEYWAKNYSDSAKALDQEYVKLFDRKLGEDVFWRIIASKILKGAEYFYCQYCYLFSADNSGKKEKLTKYYRRLGFDALDNLNVLCADDDRNCQCLAMSLSSLREKRDVYLSELLTLPVWDEDGGL